ncbi:MAG: hypothetical protein WC797_01620 [Candidatus Paceibacterota bacterium]|jgi:hypothetical protein
MDQEDKKILKEVLELSKENNSALKKMHRSAVYGKIFKLFYWAVIIGAGVWSYYLLQPMVDQLLKSYNEISGSLQSVKGMGDSIKNLGGSTGGGIKIDPNSIPPDLMKTIQSILGGQTSK